MDKLRTNLSQLELRLAALTDKRTASAAALADAVAARDRHNLEGDLDDTSLGNKLQAKVDHYNSTLMGLDAALATLRAQIGDTETQIAAERTLAERKAASAQLERDLTAYQKTLAVYLKAARDFVAALEPVEFWHYETGETSRFAANCAAQVEVAGAISLQELQGMVKAIAEGTMPIPPAKPKAPAPAVTVEQPEPTRTVFSLRSVKWKDSAGRQRSAMQYEDVELPLALADKALRHGVCVSVQDDRRKTLKGARGGHHPNVNAIDIVDLDVLGDASGAIWEPPIDPVLARANFEVVHGRPITGTINVARVL